MVEAGPADNDPLAGVPGAERVGRLSPDEVGRLRRLARYLPPALITVILAWFAYLLVVSWLSANVSLLALLAVPTVGLFLFNWLGYYRHELWHNYFPHLDNPTWYNIVSYLLFSDPQIYRAAHASHHKYVHTAGDLEFFCEDWESNRGRRRRQFLLEFFFGNIAWEFYTFERLKHDGRVTGHAALMSVLYRGVLALVLLAVAFAIGPMVAAYGVLIVVATIWLGAVVTRQNQWVEHLGIVSDGDIVERNLLTRNLAKSGLAGWLFSLIVHEDPDEHVYHHTDGRLATRNTGLALPDGAVTISLREYAGILRNHYRTL